MTSGPARGNLSARMSSALDPTRRARLAANLRDVQARIAACARSAGREPGDVGLVAVTKTVEVEVCAALLELGVRDLGENRADVLEAKHAAFAGAPLRPRWHWIGHLQRNKARRVLLCAEVLHSLDSLRLFEACERIAAEEGLQREVYLQLKLWPEEAKGGLDPAELPELLAAAREARHLRTAGLMAMAPLVDDESEARRAADLVFARCAELARAHAALFPAGCRLSMGMSGDYDLAIARGAHWVRVGSALYAGLDEGPREETA